MKNNKLLMIENVEITSSDKIMFKPNITKKQLVIYYQKVASRMLPYLEKRLISAVRCPGGAGGEKFYKKHLGNKNNGLGKVHLTDKATEKDDYYYIKTVTGLISEVQLNTIEFHIWGSKINNLNKPDMIVFDLDPDEGLGLNEVREGVKDLKNILDNLSLTAFLKTSGGKGYHIVIPLDSIYSWNKVREFAKNIVQVMEEIWPNRYVSSFSKKARKGKIFIDWMRNIKEATSVAPYSLRIKKEGTVSMPIKWSELDKVAPDEITIAEAIKRLRRKDPWEGFFEIKGEIK